MSRKSWFAANSSKALKLYAFVYWSLYETVRLQGDDGWVHWKAGFLLMGSWAFLLIDVILIVQLMGGPSMARHFIGVPAAVISAGISYSVCAMFVFDQRWRDLHELWPEWSQRKATVLRNVVVCVLAGITVAAFGLMHLARGVNP